MTIRNRRRWASLLFIVLLHSVAAGAGAPYVEPDFSARIINVDAVSLEGEDRAKVVSALATLAGAEEIETLVRMKAIAIALRLDSMHPAARNINDLLIAGGPIVPGADGADGAGDLEGAVSLLRETAQRLRDEKREEEDAVLYPYLMDIAGGASGEIPQPDGEALQGELHWELVLGSSGKKPPRDPPATTQPGDGKTPAENTGKDGSTGATKEVAAAGEGAMPAGSSEKMDESPAENMVVPENAPDQGSGASAVKLSGREAALRVVVFEEGPDGEKRALACRLSAKASQEESTGGTTHFHSDEGIRSGATEQVAVAAKILRRRHSIGPLEERIDLELTSLEDGRALPLEDTRLGVTVLFLLDALLSGTNLDDSVSLGGTLPTAGGKVAPRGRWGAIVEAAGRGGAKTIVVSRSAETDLTDLMIAGELEALLRVQAVQLSEAEEVGNFLTESRDENVEEAMRLFEEVQGLTGRHEVKDLMANIKVQERLAQVVSLMPNHLSAKLLLGYGRGTLPQRMSLRGSVRLIDSYIEPVRGLGETTNTAVIASSQDDLCADSLFALRRVRYNLSEGALAYCDAAVDYAELLREYLKVSNRSTSGAMQQAAAVEAARSQMERLHEGFEAALKAP